MSDFYLGSKKYYIELAHGQSERWCWRIVSSETGETISTSTQNLLDVVNKIVPSMTTSCQEWFGRQTHNGYGQLTWGGREWRAHRLIYLLFKGPIPDEMLVCHTCDVRCCVNPDHLFLGTAADNIKDMDAKGRRAPKIKGKRQMAT